MLDRVGEKRSLEATSPPCHLFFHEPSLLRFHGSVFNRSDLVPCRTKVSTFQTLDEAQRSKTSLLTSTIRLFFSLLLASSSRCRGGPRTNTYIALLPRRTDCMQRRSSDILLQQITAVLQHGPLFSCHLPNVVSNPHQP